MGRDQEPEPGPEGGARTAPLRAGSGEAWERALATELEALGAAIRRHLEAPSAPTPEAPNPEAPTPEALAAALGLKVVLTDQRSPSLFPETLAIPRSMEPRRAGEAVGELAARALALHLAERLARAVLLPEARVRAALESPGAAGQGRMRALRGAFPQATDRQLRARLRELGLPLPTLPGPGPP